MTPGTGYDVRVTLSDPTARSTASALAASSPPPDWPSNITNETDAYDNFLYQHTDDAFEAEDYCANIRLGTTGSGTCTWPLPWRPPGRVRPTSFATSRTASGNTRASQQDGYTASALKINVGDESPTGPLYLYHNTFLTDAPGTEAISLMDPGVATFIRARNNVMAGTHYAIEKINPVPVGGLVRHPCRCQGGGLERDRRGRNGPRRPRLHPAGTPTPPSSAINFMAGKVRANNAIVVLGGDGEIAVRCDMVPGSAGSTDLVLDAYG